MNTRSQAAARALLSSGLSVVPVLPGTKKCVLRNWSQLRIGVADLSRYFRAPDGNVGVLWGAASGGIVDVDLDHPLVQKYADQFLPPTGATWGRPSKPRSHRLYRIAGDVPPTRRFNGIDGERLIDLQSDGSMSVAPGSVHPSGEPIDWDDGAEGDLGSIGVVEGDELIAAIERLVAHVRSIQANNNTDTNNPETPSTQTPEDPRAQRPRDPKTLKPKDPRKSEGEPDFNRPRGVDEQRLQRIIDELVVTGAGQHDSKNFKLARVLKIDAGYPSEESARAHFQYWWERSKANCQEQDFDVAWGRFVNAWERAAVSAFGSVAARVLSDLKAVPPYPNSHGYGTRTSEILSAVAQMARLQPTEPFTLTDECIAKAFGMTPQNAGHLIRLFAYHGYIEIVQRGVASKLAHERRARRVRWIAEL